MNGFVPTEKRITAKEAVQNTFNFLTQKYQFIAIEELDRKLFFWNSESGLWEPAEIHLRKELEKSHQDYADEKFIRAVLDKIRNNFPKKLRDIPAPPSHLIPLRTAIWDLNKNQPILYASEHFFFQKANVDAIKEIEFPIIQKFEQQLFGDDAEKINTYRKILAYTLANGYPIKKAFIFYGPGDCGKSKAIQLAELIVGPDNFTNIALQDLLHNRFAKARLFKKKLNTFADLPPSIVRNPGEFKVLTGSDNLAAEKKGKDGFDFKNEAKFIFSCNQIPEADPNEVDITFFYRWEFLDFEKQIPKEKQDPAIIEKLLPEINGYCYKLIQELKGLLETKKFSDRTPEECQEIWMSHSVSVPQFVEECIEYNPGATIEAGLLMNKYIEFCMERKLPAQTPHQLGKTLKAVRPECFQGYSSKMIDGVHQSIKVWRNVSFRELPTMPIISSNLKEKCVDSTIRVENIGGIGGIDPGSNLEIRRKFQRLLLDIGNGRLLEELLRLGHDFEMIKEAKKQGYLFEPTSGFIQIVSNERLSVETNHVG